jgi:hypothetical protein
MGSEAAMGDSRQADGATMGKQKKKKKENMRVEERTSQELGRASATSLRGVE